MPDEATIAAMTEMQYPQFVIDLVISLNHTIIWIYENLTEDDARKLKQFGPFIDIENK